MSKKTITLFDYLQAEFIKQGHSEFFKDGQISKEGFVFYNERYSIIHTILTFNTETYSIINERLFLSNGLDNLEHDYHFKKAFVTRFLNREIQQQTIESFMAQLIHVFTVNEHFINQVYENLDKYIVNQTETSQGDSGESLADSRNAFSELPQDEVQLDVNDTVMNYAKENTISRNKQTNKKESETINKSYQLDQLLKTKNILNVLFDEFDKKCFLQTW